MGNKIYVYEAFFSNGEVVEFQIEGESELQRDVRLKYFLEKTKDTDLYFTGPTGRLYNKDYIVSVKLKGV